MSISGSDYPAAVDGVICINEGTHAELFSPDNPSEKKVIDLPEGAVLIPSDEKTKSLYFYTDLPSEKEGYRAFSLYRYNVTDGKLIDKITEDIPSEEISVINISEYGDYAVMDVFLNNSSQIILRKLR